MDKIKENLIGIGKGFLSFIIFFSLQLLTSFIIVTKQNINKELVMILCEIITFIILLLINFKKIKNDFKDFDKNYKNYLKIGIKAWILGLIIMIISNLLINTFITTNIAKNEAVDRTILLSYPIYSVIAMIIIGPFNEEMIFRLAYHKNVPSRLLYYITSVLLFAGAHVLNGISYPQELLFFIPYGALAFAFSYILNKTNNIFTSTIIHILHNIIAILIFINIGV